MYSIVSAEGQQLRLQLHPEHEIYQAHFPGNPITPGVCQVQIVAELAGRQLQRHRLLHPGGRLCGSHADEGYQRRHHTQR